MALGGPLAPEVYDATRPVPSWWEASAPPDRARPALDGDQEADVAIIGGGYAGLSAARVLAGLGIGAAVLEAGAIGWGASGRNGGIAGLGGHKLSDAALVRRFGAAEVARYHARLAEHLRDLRAFCLAAGLSDQVQGSGELVLAHSPRAARGLDAVPEGFAARRVAPSGLHDVARFGGAVVSPAFGIHPLWLVRAIADAAEDAGARVFARSPVTEWRREGRTHRLVTPGGSLRAHTVLVATNGFTPDGLHPSLDGRAIPVISNIAVTRVLSAEERARHPWLGADPAADTRNMLSYFRLLPEGRLLFGMRGDITGAEANAGEMRARVIRRIGQQLPGFAGADVEYFWRGPVCATARLTPAVGWLDRERRIACCFGWHGSGIGMGTLGGALAAGLIAGAPEEAIPAPMRGPAPRLPLPGLRPLYVGAALALLAAQDRIT
ncbi:FAD-binding oxidoreductase [Limibaculum sp. FT325]|uniref:NAD(P)/FAD-dependent oxidoreductase n=1 Tax=Thermohalobaculum sediminis TaxID=2939436 RepID=UPI0020BE6954|nr:FAD-binding oxidoreductase [Limibaculum sediminis]MCL5777495.1 FAD-binding oxidoreductase [Limibaculum sediminis]